jgi:uncharacterized SAM-binding protein YcdF (DUF218 family)
VRIAGLFRLPRVLSPWWWAKRLCALALVLYLGGTYVEVWSASRTDSRKPSQAIVVLGAAQYNGKPSPVLRARLDHALALYDAGVAPMVIVTGGRQAGDVTTEAAASAKYLMRGGVPDRAIRREVKGRDTYESLRASKRFLAAEGISKVVLVTDGYHAARVRATAREVGLSATSSAVPGDAPLDKLIAETGAVAIGRIIGFRRLAQLTN